MLSWGDVALPGYTRLRHRHSWAGTLIPGKEHSWETTCFHTGVYKYIWALGGSVHKHGTIFILDVNLAHEVNTALKKLW